MFTVTTALGTTAGKYTGIAELIAADMPGWVCSHFARPYDLKEGTLKNRLPFVRPAVRGGRARRLGNVP